MLNIGVLNGDDIGHEIVPETVAAMDTAAKATGLDIAWTKMPIGRAAFDELGTTMPADTLDRLSQLDGWVLGPIGHRAYPKDPAAINPHPILRKHFDLYANIRPARSYKSVPCVHQGVDLIIVRENNEGFQPDRNVVAGSGEFRPSEDMTISIRVITRNASSKVARAAFELAQNRRKKLTAVHKDTVFKLGCGMFAEECRRVAADFPEVEYEEVMVDTFAMKLAMKPQQYDVVVTTNMFGDILSDEAAGLVGGLGMAPGLSAGPKLAMAQATHGSAPDIAGRGIANPFAMIISGAMLLDWLGHRKAGEKAIRAAALVRQATDNIIERCEIVTPDLGGKASTSEMGAAICAEIRLLAKA
jgi:3-isopropylmalate dehydrogenase